MKKCRIILPLLAFAMLFTGCTKEIITYGSQISTYRFNVTPSKYKGTGAGNAEKNRL